MGTLALALLLSGDGWLPLEPGTRWTYEVREDGPTAPDAAPRVVSEVGASHLVAGRPWTEIRSFLGYDRCFVRSSEAGLELRTEATEEAPSLIILKPDARAGESWTGTLGREEVTFTAGATETLEQEGRRWTALRVSFSVTRPELHAGHPPTEGELWFARGTGLVRARITKDLDCQASAGTVWVLK